LTFEAKQAAVSKFDRIARKWEQKFGDEAANQFELDRRRLLAIMQKEKAAAIARKATIGWQNILMGWQQYMLMAGGRWREAFIPLFQGVITDQGNAWNDEFGMTFDVRNLFGEVWFSEYPLKFSVPIQKTTSATLHELIANAQAEGWSIPDMERGLGATFDKWIDNDEIPEDHPDRQFVTDRMPVYRREMIARTETIRASNAGSQALFNDWGVELKEWIATPDNRARATHLAAWSDYSEGGTPGPIPMDQVFGVGGSSLMYPGDPSGSPGETINCRCVLVPFMKAFEGTPEEVARDRALLDEEIARREAEAQAEVERGQVG